MSSTEGGDPKDPPPPSSDTASPADVPPAADDKAASVEPVKVEASAASATTMPAASDDILPARLDDDALREAVGAPIKKKKRKPVADEADESSADPSKLSRKTIVVSALAVVGGVGVAALVLLGRVNTQRFVLDCTTTQAVAEQGRAFPPWGTSRLPGAEWRPIPLPANAQCKSADFDSREDLEKAFLDVLLERANATLDVHNNLLEAAPTAVDGKLVSASPLDLVSMQLEQALLLSRAPERGDQRKQVERLQGDVLYWRAALRLRTASSALTEAARQYEQASLARPMHVSDAGSWADLVHRIVDELHAGPAGAAAALPPAVPGVETRAPAPTGTALPVEPTEAPSEAPAATPDAGVPTGGVLL